MNYDEIHQISLKFCKAFRNLSVLIGGIPKITRDDFIEMFCLENDSFDEKELKAIISEMLSK